MTTSRVRTLAIRIWAGEARPVLAEQCTSLARRVLNRMADLLDRGERVVLIRQLDIRWRLPEESIEAEDTLARLVSDLVAALEPAWLASPEVPKPDSNVVVFPDTASWWADAIRARSEGHVYWYHEAIADDDLWLQLSKTENRGLALAVLRTLGENAPNILSRYSAQYLQPLANTLDAVVPEALIRAGQSRLAPSSSMDPTLAMLLKQFQRASFRAASAVRIGLSALALHLAKSPPRASLEEEARRFSRSLTLLSLKQLELAPHTDKDSSQSSLRIPLLQPTFLRRIILLGHTLVRT